MTAALSPAWSSGQASVSRTKDAYGATEFAGIAVNGQINASIETLVEPAPRLGWQGAADAPVSRGELLVRLRGWPVGRPAVRYWGEAAQAEAVAVARARSDASDETAPAAVSKAARRWLQLYEEGWFRTGDAVVIDHRQQSDDPRGRIIVAGRVGSKSELYWKGRSVWIAADSIAGRASIAASVAACVVYCDRNQPRPVLLVLPERSAAKPLVAATPAVTVLVDVLSSLLGPRAAEAMTVTALDGGLAAVAPDLPSDAALEAAGLRPYEVPAGVVVVEGPWSAEDGQLTSTGKPRAFALVSRHRESLDAAYAGFEALQERLAEPLREGGTGGVPVRAAGSATAGDGEIDPSRGRAEGSAAASHPTSPGRPTSLSLRIPGRAVLQPRDPSAQAEAATATGTGEASAIGTLSAAELEGRIAAAVDDC
ncbi:hypothetical protein FNF29_04943 [Cafeteria roenbergensis]|uniref:AMP-dependent synthetase/ligase domain-containing protein n=1 Tax=Cafeteria roenbergensis TaxID=33653 RepID=A0A5A8CDS1_CAFRO|nr:hypothetical protein FNF29_04943 [Cafeteria roenbergensis]|eukprot:KAA0150829.1 hypothetical protein FNF29_04943 [Cafeteria roenbergensis]